MVLHDFTSFDESPYDVIVGLPTMIQFREWPDYYRMLIMIHLNVELEILNYEYEHKNGHTSENEFTSTGSEDIIDDRTEDELALILLHVNLTYDAADTK